MFVTMGQSLFHQVCYYRSQPLRGKWRAPLSGFILCVWNVINESSSLVSGHNHLFLSSHTLFWSVVNIVWMDEMRFKTIQHYIQYIFNVCSLFCRLFLSTSLMSDSICVQNHYSCCQIFIYLWFVFLKNAMLVSESSGDMYQWLWGERKMCSHLLLLLEWGDRGWALVS